MKARSKEKAPVTVVLLDGDETGEKVYSEVTGENLLSKNQVTKISDAELSTNSWCTCPQTLEDLVPPILLCQAVVELAQKRWNKEQFTASELATEWEKDSGASDEQLVTIVRKAGGPLAGQLDGVQLRAATFAILAELLLDENSALETYGQELQSLETVMRECCNGISSMLELARTSSRQDRLLKSVRLEIERYKKLFGQKASKADVTRCLDRLDVLPVGASDTALKTRENLLRLRETVNNETAYAGLEVDAAKWVLRFGEFGECPWNC